MSTVSVTFVIENPEKPGLHRNRNANRSLKLGDTISRVHKELLGTSKVLAELMRKNDRTLLKLDHLTAEQENFTPCGLDMVLDWMYGRRIEFNHEQLTDALAAAFVLKMYDMLQAIEEAVLTHLDDPVALVILLYHVDNFTPQTRRKILTTAGIEIGRISRERPFAGCPPTVFKRLVKAAIDRVGDMVKAVHVIQAILIWSAENHNNDLVVPLLQQVPIDDLSNDEVETIREIALDCGLKHLVAVALNRYYALSPLSVSRRLDYDESDNIERCVEVPGALIETREDSWRIAAGKNIIDVDTSTIQEKRQIHEEQAGMRIVSTPEDQHMIRKMMEKAKAVRFGVVPLQKSHNDLRIEITYQGKKEAAKEEPVRLYFDLEIDPPPSNS